MHRIGRPRLASELLKKRRRTEVSAIKIGSASAHRQAPFLIEQLDTTCIADVVCTRRSAGHANRGKKPVDIFSNDGVNR
jgi:hypothetical protein